MGRSAQVDLLCRFLFQTAASGGSAVAEVATTSLSKKDKWQTKKIAKKQADKRIKKKALAST
ncbi:MAG: hypothetical protein ACR2N5_03810 [Solirubrobacterales bacterium]